MIRRPPRSTLLPYATLFGSTNTGNTTLHGVTVHDSLTGNDLSIGDLAVGASATVYDSYSDASAEQAAIDAGYPYGSIVNTATATDDRGDYATSTVSTPTEAEPGLSVVKTWSTNDAVDGDDEVETAGQEIDYTIVVTKIGNASWRERVEISVVAVSLKKKGDLAGGASANRYDSYSEA